MIQRIFILFAVCAISTTSLAMGEQKASSKPLKRAIYITFDGTRWQDVFLDHERLPIFWKKYAKDMRMYGNPMEVDNLIEVASKAVSLPSYQSQLAGAVQPCDGNSCGRITVETFPESILNRLKLNRRDVVVFSSWDHIGYAAEHHKGTLYTNIGNAPAYDPDTGAADDVMLKLNQEQNTDQPGNGDRYDQYTFAQAIHYLEKYQPRFMWISLNDADDAAHSGNVDGYYAVLSLYDKALDHLFKTLKRLGVEDDTLIVITTDHGRGNGKKWTKHGPAYPESSRIWAFVRNGSLISVPKKDSDLPYSTLSMRKTFEAYFDVNELGNTKHD